jgi:hypothetical protein
MRSGGSMGLSLEVGARVESKSRGLSVARLLPDDRTTMLEW